MSEGITYEEYLATHKSLTYANVGTSMLPLLRESRDLFTVVPKEHRSRVGDVILYRRHPEHWVLHRVVEVLPGGYMTLGDNSVTRERVAEEDVLGVMTAFARDGRTHHVDEWGYRIYTWVILASEAPRIAIKRMILSAKGHLGGLHRDR